MAGIWRARRGSHGGFLSQWLVVSARINYNLLLTPGCKPQKDQPCRCTFGEECAVESESMPAKAYVLSLTISIALGAHSARACDPNEECNRCLASAFGHCITNGNDPICEARKLACQRAPVIVNTPGSPLAPGGPLGEGGPGGLSVPQIQQCIADLSACPGQIIARLGYQTVAPIVDGYIGFLNSQVGSNVYGLDDDFIASIQQYYPIDLPSVRYTTNINTLHGMNITIGNVMYFV
jgi:hypothetical protein